MPTPAEENRRRVAQARVDEGGKQKYRPPKKGTVPGNRAFARKDKGRARA